MLPAPGGRAPNPAQISNARAFYPLVGLVIGAILVGVEWACSLVFPPYLTAAILVSLLAVLTRGLHLDGLMDTCDGLWGGYTPERRLEIMHDPNVGAFAVVGAVAILLLKYAALVSLLMAEFPGQFWVLLLFPTLSRWAMVVQLGLFQYVRSTGLGSPFQGAESRLATVFATITVAAASLLLGGYGGAVLAVGVTSLALLIGLFITRLVGGLTGDSYGATNETCEVAALLAGVALIPHGLIQPFSQILALVPA